MDLETIRFIAQVLHDKKAANVIAIDVQDISTITDTVIIAEGTVDRHIRAKGSLQEIGLSWTTSIL
jgi:ribosome-associated protein